MLFGLTGAHRSGKTTLARAVAEELGIDFYETSISKTAKSFGYDATGDLSLMDRLHLQTLLLQNHLEELDKRSRPLICDRTPLDFLGYLACEFTMKNGDNVDLEVLRQAANFADKCLEATRSVYDFVFYLAPLPDYVVEDGKPSENPIYQMHHALVVQGGISELKEQVNSALIFDTDWDVRKDFLHETIVQRLDVIDRERRSAIHLN